MAWELLSLKKKSLEGCLKKQIPGSYTRSTDLAPPRQEPRNLLFKSAPQMILTKSKV